MNILTGHIYRHKSLVQDQEQDLPNRFLVVGIPDTASVHTVQEGADPNNPKRWDFPTFVDNFELAINEPQPASTPAATQSEASESAEAGATTEGAAPAKRAKTSKKT